MVLNSLSMSVNRVVLTSKEVHNAVLSRNADRKNVCYGLP